MMGSPESEIQALARAWDESDQDQASDIPAFPIPRTGGYQGRSGAGQEYRGMAGVQRQRPGAMPSYVFTICSNQARRAEKRSAVHQSRLTGARHTPAPYRIDVAGTKQACKFLIFAPQMFDMSKLREDTASG
jgi:hypothetical protein